MVIFYFPQFEHELFWRHFKLLHIFLGQSGYFVGIWKILNIVDEDVSSETRTLLEYWGFPVKLIHKAWYFVEWIVSNSFEFKKANCFSRY